MQIFGPAHVHGPQSIAAPHAARPSEAPRVAPAASVGDQLEISETAELLSRINELPDVRHDRVAALRAAIAEGTYESTDKLDTAVSRLLDEIG